MKKILVFILILFLFSCGKKEGGIKSRKIDVIFTPYDFTSIKLTVFRIEKGNKVFLGNYPIKVRMQNYETNYQTDEKGEILLKVPEELTTTLDKIYAYISDEEFEFEYTKRKVLMGLGADISIENYHEINFLIFNIKKIQQWPPEGNNFLEERIVYNGNLQISSAGFTKNISVLNGFYKLCLNAQEAENLWNAPFLTLTDNKNNYYIDLSKYKPSKEIIFLTKDVGIINFRGRIKNETLYSTEVEVTAGYKLNDNWLIGDFIGIKYYNSQIVKMYPGQEKEISFHYPPPIAYAQRDVEIKILSSQPYSSPCK